MLSDVSSLLIRHRLAPFMMGTDATIAIVIPHQAWLRPMAEEIHNNFLFWKLGLTQKSLSSTTSDTNVRVLIVNASSNSLRGLTLNLVMLPQTMPLTRQQEQKIAECRESVWPCIAASSGQMMFY